MKNIFLILLFTAFSFAKLPNNYSFYKANNLYKSGKYKEAIAIYEKIEPKDDAIYYNIANSYYRLKNYQKAIDYYKLINSQSYNAKKLYNIANAYVQQKNYLKAIIFYRQALKFSKNPKIKENLEYAKKHMVALRDVMLSNAKCSVTLAELDNFDDDNVSKDLQDAKYKPEQKFNILDSTKKDIRGLIESDTNSSETNSTKVLKLHQKLINDRSQEKLKERSSKTLLIPIEEKKWE